MQRLCLSIVIVGICTTPVLSQEIDKKKLREVLQLPSLSLSAIFTIQPDWLPPAKKQAILDVNLEKAVELSRARLETNPTNGVLLAEYGLTLAEAGFEQQAEEVLNDAARKGITGWRCCLAVGEYKFRPCLSRFSSLIDDGKFEKKQVENLIDRIESCAKYYEIAVQLAPKEAEPNSHRGVMRFIYSFLVFKLHQINGQENQFEHRYAEELSAAAKDLSYAASLKPKELQATTAAVVARGHLVTLLESIYERMRC